MFSTRTDGAWEVVVLRDHTDTAVCLAGDGVDPVPLDLDPAFGTLVLWTLPDLDFICDEPWTAPADALNSGRGLMYTSPEAPLNLAWPIAP